MIVSLFFERPWLLLAVLIAVQFGLISLWSWRRTRLFGRLAIGGFIVAPLLLMLCSFVVTDRERVIEVCQKISRAVKRGDVAAVSTTLATNFRAADLDRAEFLLRLEDALTRNRVDRLRLRNFRVTFSDAHEAEVVFDASCAIRQPDGPGGQWPSRWRFALQSQAERWMITLIDVEPMAMSPVRNLRDLIR